MASAWTRTLPLLSAVGTTWRWSTQPRWLGGRSAQLLALLCPGGRRVRQQAAVGPPKEGITTAMIDELSALLVDARCRRPRGELTYARQAEWEISVKRLVQNHAATAEAATECHQDPARAISLSDLEGSRPGSGGGGPGRPGCFLAWWHHCPDSGAASAEVDQQECPTGCCQS